MKKAVAAAIVVAAVLAIASPVVTNGPAEAGHYVPQAEAGHYVPQYVAPTFLSAGALGEADKSAQAALASSPPTLRGGEFMGRKAWVLGNGTIRVSILRHGGQIAEVRLLSDNPRLSINPMFIPAPRPGSGQAGDGYMGHIVCVPHFGPASPEERKAGLRGHGEAAWLEWKETRPPQIDGDSVTLFHGAELPQTQYRFERVVTLKAGESAIRIEDHLENLAPYDRPYNHDQHATFGAPFVAPEKNILDMSATKGMTDPRRTARDQWAAQREFEWPNAPGGSTTISLREFRAVPGGQAYTPVLADPSRATSWFTLYNADYPLLVGYVFPTVDHPWIIDWQNRPSAETTAGIARGIEFGTSPYDEGLRRSVDRTQMFGTPTFKWIAARQRVSTTFMIFLREVPGGFAGTREVRVAGDRAIVVEKDSAREF